MKHQYREDGFSMVEMMVVVGIIGILVAISVPVYLNHQKQAKIVSVKSDLSNVANELQTAKGLGNVYSSSHSAVLSPGVSVEVKLRCDDPAASTCHEMMGDKPCVQGYHIEHAADIWHYDMETRTMDKGTCPAT